MPLLPAHPVRGDLKLRKVLVPTRPVNGPTPTCRILSGPRASAPCGTRSHISLLASPLAPRYFLTSSVTSMTWLVPFVRSTSKRLILISAILTTSIPGKPHRFFFQRVQPLGNQFGLFIRMATRDVLHPIA